MGRGQIFLVATTMTACGGGACGAPPSPSAPVVSADASASEGADAGADATADAPVSATADTRPRGDSDDGAIVTVSAGQPLVVVLRSNPTTGYTWSVTEAPPSLGTPQSEMLPPAQGGEGASAQQRFTWTPTAALPSGEHTLTLGYLRPFERGKPPIKTFHLKLRAAP